VCHSAAVPVVARSIASTYCVGASAPNTVFENTGERSTCGTSSEASRFIGLPAACRASNCSCTGTSTVGMTVEPPCAGSRPGKVTVPWPVLYRKVGAVPCPYPAPPASIKIIISEKRAILIRRQS
jgi:hypothetical protein